MSDLPAAAAVPRRTAVVARTFRSLHTRNYRLWFLGQTVSQTGTWMQSIALGWLVYRVLTHSAFDLGVTAALQFAPVLVFGTIGGLVADRFDKRKVLLVTQTAFTIQAAALWLVVAGGSPRLWTVWTLALVYGFINVFDNPSRQSFAMEMVGPDDLANAVGLNSVIINASRIVGPALAGLLIALSSQTPAGLTTGIAHIFLINAVTFAAVIAALAAMRPAELHRRPPVGRARGQIRAGLRYAWHAWQLRVPLLMMAVIGTLAYNFSVILPLFAGEVFRRGGGTLGALTAAMGVGALAGAFAIASRRRPSYRLLVAVSLAFGVLILAVAVAPTLPAALALLVPMGAASIMFIATANSLLQLNSVAAMRGRVMALWAMVFLGSTPIGAPLIGLIAGHFGARVALGVGGVATVLIAVWAALELRRIRDGRALTTSPGATRDGLAGASPHTPGAAAGDSAGTPGAPAGNGHGGAGEPVSPGGALEGALVRRR